MFRHIMVPVDLAHKDEVFRSIAVAADLAKHHKADLTLISISGGLQGAVSHSHAKFGHILDEFAQKVAAQYGIDVRSENHSVPDPSVELDRMLIKVIDDKGIDLVVMATHQPGWTDHIVNSHGGRLASYAPVSVFLVREDGT